MPAVSSFPLVSFPFLVQFDAEADLHHAAVGQVDESSEMFRKSQHKAKLKWLIFEGDSFFVSF